MTEPRFRYPLKKNTYRIIDGDTVEVLLDRGWKDDKTVSVRVLGTDAPESNTRRNDLERKAGKLVTKVVAQWLSKLEGQFYASSEARPKYANRVIGRIWTGAIDDGVELSKFLLEGGFVRPYSGGKREPWDDFLLNMIISNSEDCLEDSWRFWEPS